VIAERTTSAMRHKKSVGEVYSPVPFGFKAVDGRLEQVEQGAKWYAFTVKYLIDRQAA
jgi:hypothetical protein